MKPVARRCLRDSARGFTLIEVLVALLIMAILATLSWQGLDGIVRARERSRDAIDATVRLTTVMTQWEQDLQALVDTGALGSPLTFDGMTLRLTRRSDGGVMMVAWAVRNGVWQRWTSPLMTRVGEVQDNWMRSQALQGNEPMQLTVASDASQWQIYFNRGGQWTNAQSTGDLAAGTVLPAPEPPASAASGAGAVAAAGVAGAASAGGGAGAGGSAVVPPAGALAAAPVLRELLPDAVRLQITLGGKVLTRDIALGAGG